MSPLSLHPVSARGPVAGFLVLVLILLLAGHPAQAEQRVVRVGVFENPPIVFQDAEGRYTGLAIDLLRHVAERHGWKLQFVPAPWQSLLGKLDRGDIDLLLGIAYTPERATRFDFTGETLLNNYGVVMRRAQLPISSVFDLRDRRVAMMSRSIHSTEFSRMMAEFDIPYVPIAYQSYQAALQAVDRGDADAAIVNRAITMLHSGTSQAVATGIVFNPVEVRYATPKGRGDDLLAALDLTLATEKLVPDSPYQQMIARWTGASGEARLPAWSLVLGGLALLTLLVLGISNRLIRREVARRTLELSESEARFRQLADNVKDVFWVCSPDWRHIHYVSPAFESIWGTAADTLYQDSSAWLEPVHPADRDVLQAAMAERTAGGFAEASLPDFRVAGADGRTHWIQARAYPIHDEDGQLVRIAGLAEDITERKAAEDTIRFMAYHDPLTRLHNRPAFEHRLRAAASREDGATHALMYVDLDQFKVLNDTCGHAAGDQMLQGLTAHLQQVVVREHTLARLGGDEFGILLEDCSQAEAEQVAAQVLDAIRAFRFTWGDKIFTVGACIGLVMIEDDRRPLSGLLSAADIACYAAKDSGRNRIHVYRDDDAMLQQREDEMHWVSRLKEALDNDGFVLHSQPIVSLRHPGNPDHQEFLLRLKGGNGELIGPGAFLPAAERFDLMPALDRWVVSQVFEHIGQRPGPPGSIAFVNLSGQVLNDDGFGNHVLKQLQLHGVRPGSVCLEITETAAIANLTKATRLIEALRHQGVLFALDDFGTGMSSFSYLKTLPVDFLKIDGFFIKDLMSDHMNPAIVEAITQIGHTAGLQVIAEWVEDSAALRQLRNLEIDFAQGYAIGRPMPLDTQSTPPQAPNVRSIR